MPTLVQANEATAARRRIYFHLVDATDGITAETGEAGGQPQISTNGGAFTNTNVGTLTHMGNGRYYADVAQAAVATAGDIIESRYKSANTAECPGDSIQVIAPSLVDAVRGLSGTALPNAVAGANGGVPTGDASGRVTLTPTTISAIWADASRTLTGFGTLAADTATAVWAAGSRTLTGFGTLVADTATAVWASASRTLTAFAFTVTTSANATETAIETKVTRLLGLAGENMVLRSAVYDGDGNLTSATIRLYDSAANATTDDGTTGLVASYAIANTVASTEVTVSKTTKNA